MERCDSVIKWGDTHLALLFLSPISLFSVTFLIFNDFGHIYNETATPKSTSQATNNANQAFYNGSAGPVPNHFKLAAISSP